MGAFSTGIMLMGIAFIYGGNANGSFYIDNINLGEGKMPVIDCYRTGVVDDFHVI